MSTGSCGHEGTKNNPLYHIVYNGSWFEGGKIRHGKISKVVCDDCREYYKKRYKVISCKKKDK